MYICRDCGEVFEDLETEFVDLEEEAGVGSEFGDHHYEERGVCPACGYFDIHEMTDEEYEEWENGEEYEEDED